jgi:hypothetical protein
MLRREQESEPHVKSQIWRRPMSATPVEKQSQVVSSPDGKLQILNHTATLDQFGCYTIKGAIRNTGPESDVDVEIRVDYYDIDGKQIDTEIDVLVIPKPGGSRGFHIIYPGLRHDDVKSYRIYPSAKKSG